MRFASQKDKKMKIYEVFQQLSRPQILQGIIDEIQRRQAVLIQLAEEDRIRDSTDRDNILRYLRDKQLPGRPHTIEEVMKNFASSALSYHIIRRSLGSHIGAIPTTLTIAKALALEFAETRFLDDTFWNPPSMEKLALDVARRHGLTNAMLGEKTLHSRILGVLHDGACRIEIETKNGLDAFYVAIEQHLTTPESAWNMLERFTADVRQVSAPLGADFMKNIGFHMFVKPDFHFLRRLPELTGLDTSYSPRNAFILGWLLAPKLKMCAFAFDHTLYQWGRHAEKRNAQPTRKGVSNRTYALRKEGEI
jgi:hypothetical protein